MFCLFFLVFLVRLGWSSHSLFDTMVSDSIPVACPIDYPIPCLFKPSCVFVD